jgi:galactose mutarotase-like enzyme
VLGLPCWPSAPDYAQITNGAALEASGIDLESSWAKPWQDETRTTLKLGTDFDLVVLGISIGAFPYLATQLGANSPAFAAMVENVKTVQTGALQLWMTTDLAGLGWQNPPGNTEPPVVGAFVEPLDTWADMTHLLPRETWPPAQQPLQLSYFCGVFPQKGPLPPFGKHEFPAQQLAAFRTGLVDPFLDDSIGGLWPNAVQGGQFRWEWLDDLTPGEKGEARLGSQFLHVNIDPSERYVLSVPGSTACRLAADGSGFSNVVLAGDWTLCEINAGCVEAAVSSGLLAAQAITGAAPPALRARNPGTLRAAAGDTIELCDEASGSVVAISPARGAIVTRFRVGEREVLYLDESTLRDPTKNVRGGIPVLFPSPGRLAGDRFSRDGKSGAMKQHGFARDLAWDVVHVEATDAARAVLSLRSSTATLAAYPWDFRAVLAYSLRGARLRIDVTVENTGRDAMPFAFGLHPYFHVQDKGNKGDKGDKAGARIETRATRAFDNVTKTVVPFSGFDLTAKEVDLHLLDHGSTESALTWANGARVAIRGSRELTRWVVWTLAGKDFVCVEPWTSPADALNSGEGLLELPSGRRRSLWVEFEASGADGADGANGQRDG